MKQQSKLRRWATVMPMFFALFLMMSAFGGCKATTVAQDIVNWTPALQAAVATVDSSVAVLDPAVAPIMTAVTVGFDAASNLLVAQAKAYLANPNATLLAQLQAAVVTFQQQVNTALLQAAKITNSKSQAFVMNAVNGVATIVTAILALVASISSKVALAQMAADSKIKLAQVEPLLDDHQGAIAVHYDVSPAHAALLRTKCMTELQQAGF